MRSSPPLTGRYHLRIRNGSLCLDFDTEEPELWLENTLGKFRLLPSTEADSSQLSLPFIYGFDLAEITLEYKRLFSATLKVLDRFVSEKHSIAIFCLRYGDAALDLVNDCPGLAFLIASRSFYRFGDERNDGSCYSPEEKRMTILAANDYPGTQSVAKIFRKIPAAECSWEFFYDLRALLIAEDTRVMKLLCHVKSVNHLLVKLLSMKELRPFLAASLVEETSCLARENRRSRYFDEIFELKDSINNAAAQGMRISPLRTVADLSVLHEQLIVWLQDQRSYERLKNVTFPDLPFPGFELVGSAQGLSRIVPLGTGIALWEEGQKMHHCVAGYADSIIQQKGKRYVYHLELPDGELATMLIGNEGGRWEIEEFRGVCNADVSAKMMSFAMGWLNAQVGHGIGREGSHGDL